MMHREVNDFNFEKHTKPATHWVAKVQDWYLLMDKDIFFCKADGLKIRPSWLT